MARKTRRAPRAKGVKTLPELRRSFEYIDEFVHQRMLAPTERAVRELQTEWLRVFSKRLSKASATAFLEKKRQEQKARGKRQSRGTRKRGGAAPLAGAPYDYTTRPGVYLPSAGIPNAEGQLAGSQGPYGFFTSYIQSGFQNPEKAAAGEAQWPSPSAVMGTNEVQKGGRRGRGLKTRKTHPSARRRTTRRGGGLLEGTLAGSLLTQAFTRPIQSAAPPSALQDTQTTWQGRLTGTTPDRMSHPPPYLLKDSMFPTIIEPRIDVPPE